MINLLYTSDSSKWVKTFFLQKTCSTHAHESVVKCCQEATQTHSPRKLEAQYDDKIYIIGTLMELHIHMDVESMTGALASDIVFFILIM